MKFKVGQFVTFNLEQLRNLAPPQFFDAVVRNNNKLKVIKILDNIVFVSVPGYFDESVSFSTHSDYAKLLSVLNEFEIGKEVSFLNCKGKIVEIDNNPDSKFKYKVLFDNNEIEWFTKEGFILPFMTKKSLGVINDIRR